MNKLIDRVVTFSPLGSDIPPHVLHVLRDPRIPVSALAYFRVRDAATVWRVKGDLWQNRDFTNSIKTLG
jgi:hypothetical protein